MESASIIDLFSVLLVPAIIATAMIKRTEMSLWLLLVSGIGLIVAMGNSAPDPKIIFFCGSNLILMLVGFANWRRTKLNLPFYIAILACFNVVANFSHLLLLLNTGLTSYYIGLITGVIGYLQLILVCSMKDSKGAMNDILNDSGYHLHSFLHMGGNNNNGGYDK